MSVIRAFTLEQAASVANVSQRRAAYWASRGVLIPSILYDRESRPHRYIYDFRDVVGLRTLGMLRDEHGLPLQQLRKAHTYLETHSDTPWSSLRFWVRGKELFFTDPKSAAVISATRPGQTAIAIELAPVAKEVEQAARELQNRDPAEIGQTSRQRNIQGNRLVVKGTRVPVETILNLTEDGYSPARIVRSYPDLTLDDVHEVLRAMQTAPAA